MGYNFSILKGLIFKQVIYKELISTGCNHFQSCVAIRIGFSMMFTAVLLLVDNQFFGKTEASGEYTDVFIVNAI